MILKITGGAEPEIILKEEGMLKVKRALISVSDKEGIAEFAAELDKMGVEIISTGGTKKKLEEAGIKAADISEVTGFPEIMDGRVKTLHPKVHGALLGLRENKEHMETMKEHGIEPLDMVVINLYPFKEVTKKENLPLKEAIENIDIGGPSMIRSAAKNADSVAVVTDKNDYKRVAEELKGGGIKPETLQEFRVKAFSATADYDVYIAGYLEEKILNPEEPPERVLISADKKQAMRYGENPHQKAAFYTFPGVKETNIGDARQLHGKELSFNNSYDIDGALSIVKFFDEPVATVIKHANPCGTATDKDITEAFKKAFAADSMSAFGGIAALNRSCTKEIAEEINRVFMEVVIAPAYEEGALDILKQKKNIRIIETGKLSGRTENNIKYRDIRKVAGGLLVQETDNKRLDTGGLKVVTKRKPDGDEMKDLAFAWEMVKFVKSNAIVLVKGGVTVGVGPGQTARVGAAKIAAEKAGDKAAGSVMASDAFFPFRDSVDSAAEKGIKAIIQPGGSKRDEESIKAADEHGIAMVFTGYRHFRH